MADGLTRKGFLQRSGLAALGAAGAYRLVDELGAAPARAAVARVSLPPEQHLMQGLRVITDNGVEVTIPPLHHQVVTARLGVARTPKALRDAKRELEAALAKIEAKYAPTPAGLSVVVGWGTPYFRRYLPKVGGKAYPAYLPVDKQASALAKTSVPAFEDTIRFPSDPSSTRLEENDLAVVFQSDSLDRIAEESKALFSALGGLVHLTSVRKGFVGGGFDGKTSLPKLMATKYGINGASSIPEHAQLFLGFTSTQRSSLGPDRIANFETLPGFTDQWPAGYFRYGTTMHLSHLYEDVDVWYDTNAFQSRVWLATDLTRDAASMSEDTMTLPEGPKNVQTEALIEQFATDPANGLVGHSASIQPVNRTQAALRDNYGVHREKGTPILQRVDFNTIDSPFFWTSRPSVDHYSKTPQAGLHFLAYGPSSDFLRRMRLAMDGRYADGTVLPVGPSSPQMGLNGVLHTTHRQNFLVPPRRHRSFPLAELL